MKVLWLLPKRRVGAASGGDLYGTLIVAGLRRLGHQVEVRSALPRASAVRADVVVQDALDFERFLTFNRALQRVGSSARRVALVHVTTAKLAPGSKTGGTEARYLASTNAALFVSEHARAESLQLLRRAEPREPRVRRTGVIPPGADRLGRGRSSKTNEKMQLICVAHLLPHKGQLALVDAFARRRRLEATLVLVGDGSIDRRYSARVTARLRQVPDARWVGPLGARALSRELARSDVFISSSDYESWGMAAAEAQAAGLPVVSWSKGGLWEFLTPGVDALRAPHANPAVLDRLADRALLATLKRGARSARPRTWARAAREFATFLGEAT